MMGLKDQSSSSSSIILYFSPQQRHRTSPKLTLVMSACLNESIERFDASKTAFSPSANTTLSKYVRLLNIASAKFALSLKME